MDGVGLPSALRRGYCIAEEHMEEIGYEYNIIT